MFVYVISDSKFINDKMCESLLYNADVAMHTVSESFHITCYLSIQLTRYCDFRRAIKLFVIRGIIITVVSRYEMYEYYSNAL